jgi:hypothetical protein
LSGIDSFIDEMMKAGNIAMAVRHQAGIDRAALADAILGAAPLSEKDHIRFAEMKMAAASPWSVVRGAARNPSFPVSLQRAVQQAQKIYFTEQAAEHDAILAQLDKGMRPSLSSTGWMQRSNRGVTAVTNVSRVAFEQAKGHLREQTGQAHRRFIGARDPHFRRRRDRIPGLFSDLPARDQAAANPHRRHGGGDRWRHEARDPHAGSKATNSASSHAPSAFSATRPGT